MLGLRYFDKRKNNEKENDSKVKEFQKTLQKIGYEKKKQNEYKLIKQKLLQKEKQVRKLKEQKETCKRKSKNLQNRIADMEEKAAETQKTAAENQQRLESIAEQQRLERQRKAERTKTQNYQNKIQASLQTGSFEQIFDTMKEYMENHESSAQRYIKKESRNIKFDNFKKLFSFLHSEIISKKYTQNVFVNRVPVDDDNFYNPNELFNGKVFTKIVNMKIYEDDNNRNWKKCQNECFKFWKELVKKEIASTAYMLRLIVNSILKNEYNISVRFEVQELQQLTGLWVDDYPKLKMVITDETERQKTKRTILGFGPSSSGKTYWAEQIIKLFDENFPKVFLSIDGGLMREQSIVYQMIIKQNKFRNVEGFSNLVTAGLGFTESIFLSNTIKKQLLNFLAIQPPENKISVYVPETLGDCDIPLLGDCSKKYKKYIDLTGDQNWIGLMIYQHLRGEQCDFPVGFKCTGTEIAGKAREKQQGKKYSSTAYSTSLKNGRTHLQKSPFCRLEIHNSGNLENQSVILEYPIDGKFKLDPTKKIPNCMLVQGKNKLQQWKKNSI